MNESQGYMSADMRMRAMPEPTATLKATVRRNHPVSGTVYDYWVSELARIPAYIEHSDYRDYLTAQIASEDARRNHRERELSEDATWSPEEGRFIEPATDDTEWGAWLEATYDPDNERMEDREV